MNLVFRYLKRKELKSNLMEIVGTLNKTQLNIITLELDTGKWNTVDAHKKMNITIIHSFK